MPKFGPFLVMVYSSKILNCITMCNDMIIFVLSVVVDRHDLQSETTERFGCATYSPTPFKILQLFD